jgi:hypothetical protein
MPSKSERSDMQSHLDLIMLAELRQQSLLVEAARVGRSREADRSSRPGLRRWLAGLLVALAFWLDRQGASTELDAALPRMSRLPGHA